MAKKYDFTKLYFICIDGDKVHANVRLSMGYKDEEIARLSVQNDASQKIYDEVGKQLMKKKVRGFYLVPEELIDKKESR